MKRLRELLASHEEWLMDRVLAYAKELDYVKYTSTLAEAWRKSIVGLSAALVQALETYDTPPNLSPDEDFTKDPITSFGILEAQRHRSRGVSLSMFLGLMKYYRQSYVDLVRKMGFEPDDEEECRLFIDRFFDRIELGFTSEWVDRSQEELVEELQEENRRLTNEKNKYLTVLESLPNPVIMLKPSREIDHMNHAGLTLFSASTVPGAFYYGEISQTLPQDWLGEELTEFVSNGGKDASFDQSIDTLTGRRTFNVKLKRMLDVSGKYSGTTIALDDITERQRAEEQLHEQNQFLNTVLESLSHPFYVVDANDYTILMANSAAGMALEQGQATCYALTHKRSTPCDSSKHPCPVAEVKRTGKPAMAEHVHYDSTGKAKDVEVHAHPILDRAGKVVQVIEYSLDITERKKAARLAEQAERLRAVGELARGVAHHFNNMLQVVMGGASVALLKLETGHIAEIKPLLDQIIASSRLGSETVKRLQTFVQRPSDVSGSAEILDLSETVRQVVETTSALWKNEAWEKGIDFKLVPILGKECRVRGIENELFEVITHLIKNSMEAMPKGGHIIIETSVQDDWVALRVADTGVGIDQENLERVFEPFFSTKGVQRAGMGLASSFGIVKAHGGTIAVESEEWKGSTFTMRLPLVKRPSESLETPGSISTHPNLNILVIDDLEPVVMMLSDGLTEFGHTVHACLSGLQGIRVFNEQPIDLVICDLGMPGMNGWDVGSKIVKICSNKGISKPPFIMLTGWGEASLNRKRMTESGVDLVVTKPVDIIKLAQVIRKAEQSRNRASIL